MLSETENTSVDLPALEIRINMLLIVGIMILGLIMLISLKIYQIESAVKREKKE